MDAQPLKRVVDVVTLQFNFADQTRFLETLSSPIVSVVVASGFDSNPSSILSGAPSVSGQTVSQKIAAGLPGVQYIVTCTVTGSSTAVYRQDKQLAILSVAGSYAPTALPTLTGVLPSGVRNVPYSATLSIGGGYQPYAPNGIASGAFPTWMGFTVVGDTLVCAGTPNESVQTSYTFSPRIVDAALNSADAPQNITIYFSTAITNWVKRNHPMAQTALDVHVDSGIIAIVGNNNTGIWSTDQGISWNNMVLSSMNPSGSVFIITKFSGMWFALGFQDAMFSIGDTFGFAPLNNAPSVTQRGNTIHNGQLYVSSNSAGAGVTTKLQRLNTVGSAWPVIDTGIVDGGNVMDMATGNGVTIMVTDNGTIISTPNMASFTNRGFITVLGNPGTGAAFLNGRFIVSSNDGSWKYSDNNGVTWNVGAGIVNRFITATLQLFIGGDGTDIYTSPDGSVWTNRLNVPGPITLNGGASADQTLAAVTDSQLRVRVGNTL